MAEIRWQIPCNIAFGIKVDNAESIVSSDERYRDFEGV
jgi:hypothetical protein